MFDPKKSYGIVCGAGPVHYEQGGKHYSTTGEPLDKENKDGLPEAEGKTEAEEVIEPEAPPPETPEFEVPPEFPVETRAQRRRGRKPKA